nr:hypothetical protein [Nostoc sp. EkiNYC01]
MAPLTYSCDRKDKNNYPPVSSLAIAIVTLVVSNDIWHNLDK